jgi:hypothetical protein
MDTTLETTFLEALNCCRSLVNDCGKPSALAWSAIELLGEVGRFPDQLLDLCNQYQETVVEADRAIESYASSVDNWKVEGTYFGVKDHCNILHFFLNVHTEDFKFFRGENWTPELICEFLQEWKGIDLTSLIAERPSQLIPN